MMVLFKQTYALAYNRRIMVSVDDLCMPWQVFPNTLAVMDVTDDDTDHIPPIEIFIDPSLQIDQCLVYSYYNLTGFFTKWPFLGCTWTFIAWGLS